MKNEVDMDFKVFNDHIHGHMLFHPLLVVIIDTPQFQRLRNLRQLGVCYFIFPSACHNRFEHCLGTSYIAGKLFDALRDRRSTEIKDIKMWEKQKLCVQIAGLCHDLGHGPFSHTWEEFLKRTSKSNWKHEEESVRMLREILNEDIPSSKKFDNVTLRKVKDAFQFYGLTDEDISNIEIMIEGKKNSKNYIFQIVNNKDNGIDVDKWEYLVRDSTMLNIPIGFDYKRLLHFCYLKQDEEGSEELCFRDKEYSMLTEMFLARFKLHENAYKHIKVAIIEEMLIDAFLLANDRLKLSDTPISRLSDHIYYKILYDDFGDDEKMKKAKELLQRIQRRDLYKCIACESVDENIKIWQIKARLSTQKPFEQWKDDISVKKIKIDLTKSNKDKFLKNVIVYDKFDGKNVSCKNFDWNTHDDSFEIEKFKRNRIVLLYKKDSVPDPLKNCKSAFKEILRESKF